MVDTARRPSKVSGLVLHAAARYDFLVWLKTWGRERAFREQMLSFARLEAGESVLDVGCGTGTLAIEAKRQVGPSGTVCGIDASPEMVARARRKARKAGLDVTFTESAAQAMPFPDAHFDVVMSTLVLHHLPRKGRQQCAAEMRRVVKPHGRVLIIDFASAGSHGQRLLAHFHRHGGSKLDDVIALLSDAGLTVLESGVAGSDMRFALAAPTSA
jgi:ubiquinone/menaquinone biosynthesis C-methylase UbiE